MDSPRAHCLNCAAPLTGPYCSQCGQHDVDHASSFRHVAEESLESFFHFDGKFLASARLLITRPGFLSREYLAGRRVRYTQPLRLYIFASFLFFAFQALIPPAPSGSGKPGSAARPESIKIQIGNDSSRYLPGPEWFRRGLEKKRAAGELTPEAVRHDFNHRLPPVLFLCVPLLALILKVLFRGAHRMYLDHLVVALHLQAQVFLAAIVAGLLEWAVARLPQFVDGFVQTLLFGYLLWAAFRAFRVVYGNRRRWTAVKVACAGAAYGVVLVVAMVVTAIGSLVALSLA